MKYVYAFEEGSKEQKYLLGGKGANLAEMTNLGLPVPPGFTSPPTPARPTWRATTPCPTGSWTRWRLRSTASRRKMGKRLGDDSDPLLVSVRSGAAVLDAGDDGHGPQPRPERRTPCRASRSRPATSGSPSTPTAASCRCSARSSSTFRATPSRTRSHDLVEERGLSRRHRARRRRPRAAWWTPSRGSSRHEAGVEFPDDPHEQLGYAIEAVFKSWNGRRARDYRRMESIPDDLGTAVNVQTMVFGNKGDDSGTGVAFTRNPSTGESAPYGDFLTNAQGEDVVAGIRITEHLDAMADEFPDCHRQLYEVMAAAREPLPRHVRHRVHDRAGSALHPPDAGRQAHRGRRAAHGRRDGRGRA